MNGRISLITTIFLDDNQVETVGQLTGNDAQTFVDIIDEASPIRIYVQSTSLIDLDMNICILSIRR